MVPLWAAALAVACGEPTTTTEHRENPRAHALGSLDSAVVAGYTLQRVPEDELWYRGSAIQSLDYLQDSAGVPLFEHEGAVHYHPVQIEWKALAFVDNYLITGDEQYLALAERLVERLMVEADEAHGALLFPYSFDFDLHGLEGETMHAPWYSGMSQGLALSVLLRLHRITGRAIYLDQARRVFPSLLRPQYDGAALTHIDEHGYYWIQEYPMDDPTSALNGFMFALLSVHEYWQATADPKAEQVLLAGVATLEAYIEDYRVPGGPSVYCLGHRIQSLSYHRTHVWQLHALARATGSDRLRDAALALTSDAW